MTSSLAQGVDNLRPESIDTHELVWERYANDWLRTSVSTYWYKAKQLIILVPDENTLFSGDVRQSGRGASEGPRVRSADALERGIARVGELRAAKRSAARDARRAPELADDISSRRESACRVPTARSFISMDGQYLSSRGDACWQEGVRSGDFQRQRGAAARARRGALRQRAKHLRRAVFRSGFRHQHPQDSILQNGRTARIGLRWKLWTD